MREVETNHGWSIHCALWLMGRTTEFMDGGRVLKRAVKRLNTILETARKHEQTVVPNLLMNSADEIMEYTQVWLRYPYPLAHSSWLTGLEHHL